MTQDAARHLPRLLLGSSSGGPVALDEHRRVHGELPSLAGLIERVERAGLRGRGGAGFPTAAKLRSTAAAAGRRRPVVVANGAEGEPASRKDRVLMAAAPHLVLDGGVAAAAAIGADELIICMPESASRARQAISQALAERRDQTSIRVELIPDGYLTGQDSALVNHLNGGPAIPTLTPPFPAERGVARRPTLVSNVETLGHLALIARHGSGWFRGVGSAAQPGSTLVTLAGAVARPGVYEVDPTSPLSAVLEAAGGTTGRARAFLIGGYSGTWLSPGAAGVALCVEDLAPLGAALGAGVIVVLASSACPVAQTARITRWLADASAGQCGPCVHGLAAIAEAVEQCARGDAPPRTAENLARWQRLITARGACAHPDGTARFLASALREFAQEFADHAAHGPCDRCADADGAPLPLPARPPARSRSRR